MSNPNVNIGQKPVWQPLPKLHPIEIHSVGFQKNVLGNHKTALFEVWKLDDNQFLGLTKTTQELGIEHAPQIVAPQEAGFESSESFQSIDKTYLESLKNEAFQNGFLEGKRIQKEEFEKAAQDQQAADLETEAANTEKLNLHIAAVLAEISKCASDLIQKSDQLHDPMKRLALHLAEEGWAASWIRTASAAYHGNNPSTW